MSGTELSIVETLNAVAVFQTEGGVEDIVSKLEREVRSIETDPTTEKGRKEIKSLAYKVARSKTALDEMGKNVKQDAMNLVKRVDADRRVISSRLDALRDEVRRPVDEYETREKERVDGIRDRIAKIELLGMRLEGLDIETLKASAEEIERLKDYDFQEFSARAQLACKQNKNLISAAIIIAEKAEAERIEAEKLAAQKAEEERLAALEAQKVREEEIAKAAAEKARKDAEESKRIELEAVAQAEKRAQERIAQLQKEAKEREARIAAERKEAIEKAEKERIAAIELERKRAAQAKEEQRIEDEKRAANKAHCGKINREILQALISRGLTEEQGRDIIRSILSGAIPHTSIAY